MSSSLVLDTRGTDVLLLLQLQHFLARSLVAVTRKSFTFARPMEITLLTLIQVGVLGIVFGSVKVLLFVCSFITTGTSWMVQVVLFLQDFLFHPLSLLQTCHREIMSLALWTCRVLWNTVLAATNLVLAALVWTSIPSVQRKVL